MPSTVRADCPGLQTGLRRFGACLDILYPLRNTDVLRDDSLILVLVAMAQRANANEWCQLLLPGLLSPNTRLWGKRCTQTRFSDLLLFFTLYAENQIRALAISLFSLLSLLQFASASDNAFIVLGCACDLLHLHARQERLRLDLLYDVGLLSPVLRQHTGLGVAQ